MNNRMYSKKRQVETESNWICVLVTRIPQSFCVSIKTRLPAGPGQSPWFLRRGSSEFSSRNYLKCFPISPHCSLPAFLFRPLLPASSIHWREEEIKSGSEITACCSPWLNHSSPLTIIPEPASCKGRPQNLSPLSSPLST